MKINILFRSVIIFSLLTFITKNSNAQLIAAGDYHSVLVCNGGALKTFGNNGDGQLGLGNFNYQNTPVEVNGLTGIIAISAGAYHTIALKNDGTVWTWGYNGDGELGDGTYNNSTVPVQVPSLTGVVSVTAGSYNCLVVKSNGTVWGWGSNWDGQLGIGLSNASPSPVQAIGLTGIVAVQAGYNHAIALKNNGTVWTTGYNGYGQLGDGGYTNRNIFSQINTLSGITSIAAGRYHSMALKNNGTVWTWGYNYYGQLGDGTSNDHPTPSQVPAFSGISSISAGGFYSLAVKSTGTAWAWGYNNYGQLGDGTNTWRYSPVQITALSGITKIAGGYSHTIALKNDGTFWTMGYNYYGQLGDATNTSHLSPVQVRDCCSAFPIAAVPSYCVTADTTVVNVTSHKNFTIANSGCAILYISNIVSSNSDFTVTPAVDSIAPFSTKQFTVAFTPTAVGSISSTLTVYSNIADTTICLTGVSALAPSITASPQTFNQTLVCNDSAVQQLSIQNGGPGSLSYSISPCTVTGPLSVVLANINQNYSAVNGVIPNRYDFTDGDFSNNINDGGNDMYDGGNYLGTNLGTNLNYSNNAIVSDAAFGIGGQYFTVKYPGLFVMAADINNVGDFNISGNNGADGGGNMDATLLTVSRCGNTYKGFVKRVYNAGDPSINHLIIVQDNSSLNHTYDTNTDNDWDDIAGLNTNTRIYYLLYASDNGGYINDANTLNIMNAFLDAINGTPVWLATGPPVSGSLNASGSVNVPIHFNSTGMLPGTYTSTVYLNSNDPANPSIPVNCNLTVTGYPHLEVSLFNSSSSCMNLDSIMTNTSSMDTLIVSNSGCDTLFMDSVQISSTLFSVVSSPAYLVPGGSDYVFVSFSPLAAGTFNANLNIYTNNVDTTICLIGKAYAAPTISLSPLSTSVTVACGGTGSANLMITNTGGGTLNWTATSGANFSSPPSGYCLPNMYYSNSCSYINTLTTTGGTTNIVSVVDGGFGSNAGSGLNYYPSAIVAQAPGSSFTVHTQAQGSCGIAYFSIWVDWNRNGTFEVGERMVTSFNSGNAMQNFVINVPVSASPGLTRMRVIDWANSAVINACDNLSGYYGEEEDFLVQIGSPGLSIVPTSGSVTSSNTQTVQLNFNSAGLNAGVYNYPINITTNDPLNPVVTYNATMTVAGLAHMQFSLYNTSLPCLNLDSIMTYTTSRDSLLITNTGCDTLHITSTNITPSQFTVVSAPTSIIPGGSGRVVVQFAPTFAGTYNGSFTIHTNVLDTTICLIGKAYSAPTITSSPTSFNVTLACADSLSLPLMIVNTGGSALNYTTTVQNPNFTTGLPRAASCSPITTATCCNMGIYNVTFGTINNTTGNATQGYQNYTATQSTFVNPGQTYSLSIQTGTSYAEYVSAWIDYNDDGIFQVGERVMNGNLNTLPNRLHIVNVTIPANALVNKALRMRVGSEYSGYSAPQPCNNVSYGQFEDYTVKISGAVTLSSYAGTIGAGNSTTVTVRFSSAGLTAGVYTGNLTFASNDPVNNPYQVPYSITVSGHGTIVLSKYCMNPDSIMQNTTRKDSLYIRNTGCDTLHISNITHVLSAYSVNQTVFNIAPGDSAKLRVTFAPTTVGTFIDTLTILNNDVTKRVCLRGKAFAMPTISTNPTSINVTLACGDSTTASFTVNNTGQGVLNWLAVNSNSPTGYCIPTYSSGCGSADYINRFTFNTLSKINSGCNGQANNYIYDLSTTTTVNKGGTYTMTMQSGSSYAQGFGVWIDYNHNGSYADAGEFVYASPSASTALFSTTVTIPANAPLGKTRVRVRCVYASTLGAGNYCTGYTYGETEEYDITINSTGFSMNPTSGTLNANSSQTVVVNLNSLGLNNGVYSYPIAISSNDPLNPFITVPVTMNVVGVGHIAVTKTCMNLDSIMQYTTHKDSLYVKNTGCDTLHITNITHQLSEFSVNQTSFNILPGDSVKLIATFAPTTVGSFVDTLTILNNDTTVRICLSGKSWAMPTISTNPDSINVTIACGDSLSYPLVINNTGGSVLNWSANGGTGSSSPPSGYCLPTMYPSNGYSYINSVTTSGGYVNVLAPVDAGFTSNVGAGVNYYPAAIVSQSPGASYTLTIQSQGSGGFSYISVWVDWNRNGVFDAAERMVNNVYTSNNLTNFTINVPMSAALGMTRMRIIDWTNGSAPAPCGGLSGWYGEEEDYLVSVGSPGLSLSSNSGTVNSSSNQTVQLNFNSLGLNNGVYNYPIIITSNDPLHPSITVPATMTVVGVGHIAVSQNCLNLDSIMQFTSSLDSVYMKNTGCDVLNITNITTQTTLYTVNYAVSSIAPGDSALLYVSFNPVAVGTFTDTITIFNSDVTKKICLTGKGYARPIINFNPTSFDVTLTCADSIIDTLHISNTGGSNLYAQLSGNGSSQIKVALIGADNTAEVNDVKSKLLATGRFTLVDTYFGQNVTPTLVQLMQYDAVLVWGDYNFANSTLLGNNLADYVDAGGGLVTGVFAVGGTTPISGRYSTGHYWCISNSSSTTSGGPQSLGTVYQTGHPIMQNVNTFNGGSSSFRANSFTVDAGATRIADWTDGRPLVATKTFGSSRVVDLGMFPPSSSVSSGWWVASTDGATLMANALFYSANTGVPWMTLNPHADTTSAGGSSNVLVGFNSTGLAVGTYNASIYVTSNDPLSPLDTIPLTLHVNGTPVMNLSANCLNMDSIMTYSTSVHSLMIHNSGCDTLRITNITNQLSVYSVNHTTYTIIPGDSASLQVTFAPLTAGTFVDTLTFISNSIVQHVCLHGIAYPKPEQCHSPNSLNVHFTICQDSIAKQINVCNTNGGSNLDWDLSTTNGMSASFDGNGDYISNNSVNLPTGSVMTAEAWIYPVSYPDATYNGIVSWGNRSCGWWGWGAGQSFLLSIQSNGLPSMATWCNDFVPSTGPAAVLNQWNHIACVLNGTSVTLYMNGVPVSGTLGITPTVVSQNLAIGATDYPGRFFNGRIDEVKVYNYALTQSQIINSMHNQAVGNEAGLKGYWNFNNGTAQDLTSFGNNGTLNGNTVITPPNAPVYSNTVVFNPQSGTTVAGGSTNVTAMFYKAGQSPGVHNFSIYLNSNDPLNAVDTIPVTMTIDSIPPTPPTSSDVSECEGNPIPAFTASANQGDTIKWYNSAMVLQHVGSPYNTGITAAGTYTFYVTATDSINGCESRKDTVTLHINNAPVMPTASNQSVCFGNAVPALTSTGTIQLWYSDVALTNQVHVGSPYNTGLTAAGTYTYYVSDSTTGCPKSPADTAVLTIHALPSKPVATDLSSCFGSTTPSLSATGTGSDTIKWYNSALVFLQNGNPLVTGLTSPGVYNFYVTQTDSLLGCISPRDTATLTIHFTPQPAASNQTACFGGAPAVLTGTGTNLKWYNSSMTLQYSGNPYNTGLTAVGVDTFYVTQTLNGCESTAKMVILTINPIPSTPVAPDHLICFGQATPLLTTTGTNIQWYSNAALTTLVHSGSPYNTGLTAVGNYIYYVTQSALGCASHADTVHLTIGPLPARPLSADQNACFGYAVPDLVAASSGSDSVKWYANANLTSLMFAGNPFTTGQTAIGNYTYYVIQKDSASGCVSQSDTVHLNINSTPTQPTASDVNACFGQSVPALTSTGTIIQWYNDSLLTNLVHMGGIYNTGITAVGSYTFYVKDSTAGCSSSTADTAVLNIYPIPVAPSTSGNASICFGQSNPTFTASGTNLNWYSNAGLTNLVHTGNSFTPVQTAAGVYTFYVTQTLNGCSSPAATVVFTIYYTPPVVVNNVSVAFGSATPNLIAAGTNIHWYDTAMVLVSTSNSFATGQTAIGAYTYYVTQTMNGCEGTPDTVTLTIHPLAPVASNQVVCFGNTVPDLTATGANINWYSNALLTTLVHTGSTFPTGQTAVGVYTYYVTQTVNNIPSPATIVTLTINAIPLAPVSVSQSACVGGTIPNLTATGTNVQWYDTTFVVHSGSPFATGNTAVGVYNYTVTQTVNGCEGPHTNVNLTINALPSTPLASDTSSCFGTATPSLVATGNNINWFNSLGNLIGTGSPYSTGVTAPGTYNYFATQTNTLTGCQSLWDTASLTINFTPPPVNSDVAICSNLTIPALTATGTNVQWYSSSMVNLVSGNSYNTGQTAVGTYSYFVTQTDGTTSCESVPDPITLTINAIPLAPVAADASACFGFSVPSLTAAGTGVQWYDMSMTLLSSGNIFATGQTAVGTYTYLTTQTAGGCQGPADTVLLTIYPIPAAPVLSGNASICFGQSNPLWTATGTNVNWYSDLSLTTLVNSGNTFTPSQTDPGVYTYYVTQNVNGCASPAVAMVFTIYFTPAISVSNISIPSGSPAPDLIASGTNITWYDTAMVVVSTNDTFATGLTSIGQYTYYVSQTMNGCESTLDTVTVTIYPIYPVASNQTACFGTTIPDLSATGANLRWYSDSTLTSLVYSGNPFATLQTAPGVYTYYVTQTVNNIQSLATVVTLTINAIPSAPVSANQNACFGGTIPDLSATGTALQWYDASLLVHTGSPFATGNTLAGVYSYSVTQTVNGCESPQTAVTLTINALPATPVSTDTAICFGSSTPDLIASGVNIKWYDTALVLAGTGSPFATGITAPGVHTFYVTQTNTITGCESQADTVNLTIHFTPPPVAPDVFVCALYSIPSLTATGNNIQWYDASMTLVHTGSSFNTGQTAIGSYLYFVTQTDPITGCSSTPDSVVLSINPVPLAPVTTNATACFGQPITPLTAVGSNLHWYSDSTLTTLLFAGASFNSGQTAVGTYTYYVTQTTFGCEGPADSISLTIYPIPAMPLASGNADICFGQSNPVFTATGTNLQWYSDSTLTTLVATGASFTPTVSAPGVYTYYITQSVNGCNSPYTTVVFTIHLTPPVSVSDVSSVFGSPTPDLNAAGTNITWYDTAMAVVSSANIFATGQTAVGAYTYYVSQTLNGCESTLDTAVVTIYPVAPTAPSQTLCFGTSVPDLTATGLNIKWYNDSLLTNLVYSGSPFATGNTAVGTYTYYVNQTKNNIISAATVVTLTINAIPATPVAGNQTVCFGSIIPDLITSGTNITWYDTAMVSVSVNDSFATGQTNPGVYTYTVTQTVNGCESPADTAVLTINAIPLTPTTSGNSAICLGSATPAFTATGTNVQWYSDSLLTTLVHTGSPFTPSQTAAGSYPYYVTDSLNGCTSPMATVVFTINFTPPVSVNNVSSVFGSPTPDLIAAGTTITWYDTAMVNVSTNDTFATGLTAVGAYTYYVSQTMNSCESTLDTVVLTIYPVAPTAPSQTICFGTLVPDLTATGLNVNWYSDSLLTNLVYSGSPFATGNTAVGTYTYYVNQTENNITSAATLVTLTINAIPATPVAANQTVCYGSAVPDLITSGTNITWYDTAMVAVSNTDTFATGQTNAGIYTYTVSSTINGCTSPADTVTLTINAIPLAPVTSGNVANCFGNINPALTATGTNVNWYGDSLLTALVHTGSPFTPSVTAAGTYSYYVTDSVNGCTSPVSSLVYTINFTPPVVANNVSVAYSLPTPDLITSGTNITWYDTAMVVVSTSDTFATGQTAVGSYTYYVTQNLNGCESAPDTVVLVIYPGAPAVTSQVVCAGNAVPDLSAVGTNINWYADSLLTTNVFSGNPFATGQTLPGTYIYYATQTVNGIQSPLAIDTLTIKAVPTAPVASSHSVCFGTSTPDLIVQGSNINWYDTAMVVVSTLDTFATGQTLPGVYNYTVTVTVNGCESAYDSVNLTIHALPATPVAANVSVCFGSPVSDFTATGTNLQWYDASATLVGTGSPFATGINTPGTYVYQVIDVDTVTGCSSYADTASLVISVQPNNPPVVANVVSCTSVTVPDMVASAGTIIHWYSDAGLTSLVNVGPTFATGQTMAGTYTYYITDSLPGCLASPVDTATLTINTQPTTAPAVANVVVCSGGAIPDLVATTGNIVNWYSDTALTTLVNTGFNFPTGQTTAGVYTYYVNDNVAGCPAGLTDTVSLTIHQTPAIPSVNDTAICFRSALAILIYHGQDVRWYNTSMNLVHTGDVYNTGHILPGIYPYYVTQTDTITGCVSPVDSVNMIIDFLPAKPVALDTTVCASSVIPNLTVLGANVQWYDTAHVIVFNGNSFATGQTLPGTYTYFVTQIDTTSGCRSTADTSQLVILPVPSVPVANNVSACTGTVIPSLSSTGTNVSWYSNATLTTQVGTGNTYATGQTASGSYVYYVTDNVAGCTSMGADSVMLTINQSAAKPVAHDTTLCAGGSGVLTSTGANPQWYSDVTLLNYLASGNSFAPGVTVAGTYMYYVADNNLLCGNSVPDTAMLTINPAPLITANTYSVGCVFGGSVTLTAYNAVSYSWAPPTGLNVTTGPTVIASPAVSTSYTVTGTNAQGCSSDTVINVHVTHTGIDEITAALEDVLIYPNPAINEFTIEFSTSVETPINIYLFNTLGQSVRDARTEEKNGAGMKKHKFTFDSSTLDAGVYMVEIVTDQGSLSRRLVLIK